MTKVFISHSTKDADFIKCKLKPFLENHRISAWFSGHDIPTAADWECNLRAALEKSDWFVLVLSPDAAKSDWVQAEAHWALERRKGRVIPIMLRQCDPSDVHLKLGRIQCIDFRNDPRTAERELLSILNGTGPSAVSRREKDLEGDETLIFARKQTELTFAVTAGPKNRSKFTIRVDQDCIVGRAKDVNLQVPDNSISRRHARITVGEFKNKKQVVITDLGSANGTFVNETRVTTTCALVAGDVIDMGETRLEILKIV
ncbi:MAG: TIR domain-containing protein [Pseudomonadota bacterium]|nr:TIR domain-containing protein [Pseudomonadota bacterium]